MTRFANPRRPQIPSEKARIGMAKSMAVLYKRLHLVTYELVAVNLGA